MAEVLRSWIGLNGLNRNTTMLGDGITTNSFIPSKPLITTIAILALAILGGNLLAAPIDQREPKPLKPFIPIIGHLIDMIRYRADFLSVLAHRRMPIATLPILNGKLYAVWDKSLIQSAFRNQNLSFVPFVVAFARRELNYDDASDKIVRESGLMTEFFEVMHRGLSADATNRMNAHALRYIAARMETEGVDEEAVIPNVFVWIRDLMTMATCESLYGAENPMRKDAGLLEDLWTFETNLPMLLMAFFPSITARKGHKARERLQAALTGYYDQNNGDKNEDAASITRSRAAAMRKFGITCVGVFELSLLHVATSNTVPTIFWLVAHVVTNPKLVERLREEALAMLEIRDETNEAVVNMDVLADKCPLLVSCYRETIRLCNKSIVNRRVMADTTITDGNGQSYLLKGGVDIQMPSDPLHLSKEVWGPDADKFSADRFMDVDKGNLSSATVKARRLSYVPFGGGRHLCPGRNFAFAENLGFMVSFLLTYDVSPLDGDWDSFKAPAIDQCAIVAAVAKPKNNGNGFGMRIKKRPGWENTKWKFTSGGYE